MSGRIVAGGAAVSTEKITVAEIIRVGVEIECAEMLCRCEDLAGVWKQTGGALGLSPKQAKKMKKTIKKIRKKGARS